MDRFTGQPVEYATVSVGYGTVSTSANGDFTINRVSKGDSIKVNRIGYKTYKLAFNGNVKDTLIVYLSQVSIMLKDVNVRARHDFVVDSIRNRKQFASVFGYQGLGIRDIFITKNPYAYTPSNYMDADNSTASILSVNLLEVASLLSKNKNTTTKLQKTLLKDEESNYIDNKFSKEKVRSLTSLKGDSLLDFMDDYRPTLKQLQKMTDYELVLYIKTSYAEFIKNYSAEKRSPFRK